VETPCQQYPQRVRLDNRLLDRFKPWIPLDFDGTLVLGESTYGGTKGGFTGHGAVFDAAIGRDVRWWLIGQVVDAAITQDKFPFYRRIREALHPGSTPYDCWTRTAHAEFIQRPLSSNQAERDWATAQREFTLLINEIRPKRVLVASGSVWQRLPDWPVHTLDGVEVCRENGVVYSWTFHPRHPRFNPMEARRVVEVLYREAP
jgi:hypothetical protein